MFEEIPFILGFLVFSLFISYILLQYTPSPLNKIVKGLAIVGIILHETFHYLMCVITNTRVKRVNLLQKFKVKGETEYGGSVQLHYDDKLTFMQAILVGFAPLIFSFWIFFVLLQQLFNPQLEVLVFFIFLFLCVSIVLSTAPSFADILHVPRAFREDVHYSLYQIFLVALSGLVIFLVAFGYQISFFHELIYYMLIMGLYYGFKYGLRGIDTLWYNSKRKGSPLGFNYKTITRKRTNSIKQRKLGIEEAQW